MAAQKGRMPRTRSRLVLCPRVLKGQKWSSQVDRIDDEREERADACLEAAFAHHRRSPLSIRMSREKGVKMLMKLLLSDGAHVH